MGLIGDSNQGPHPAAMLHKAEHVYEGRLPSSPECVRTEGPC
jgi:hypothetical protein